MSVKTGETISTRPPSDGATLFPLTARAIARAEEDSRAALQEESRALLSLSSGTWASPLCPGCGRLVERTEVHHLPGRHEGLTVRVCYPCHREVSELSRAWSAFVEPPEARALLGLADLFSVRARTAYPLAEAFARRLRSQAEAVAGGASP